MSLTIEPLRADRWPDLCALFGPGGANGGCWCMWWRLAMKDWSVGAGPAAHDPVRGNKAAFERTVASGEPTGLLAYDGAAPVGWCAVAPRGSYPRLFRSRAIGPLDPGEVDVWAVTCFFIHRKHRRAGLGHALLEAAVGFASRGGAGAIEGYPVDTSAGRGSSGDLFTGTVQQFAKAGFIAVDGQSGGKRIVMRRNVS
jgi:GNAT superfamily N-acetyltransferase